MIAGLILGLALLIAALWLFGAFDNNRILRGIGWVISTTYGLAVVVQPLVVIYIAWKVSR